ncbi:hypothetical protein EV201_2681 [Ancylomarina subtilis]|uniref:Uncharacterized protein n=1 Tax=Ancylomarina subtilis TaxID=1639035 RepID=A0A4Q7V9R8_9BACT|nr:hypothetical protein [Ancylomarina subtilis]RZT93511.1 hypothetical protein EV201_2681 [Ancylomarina subtilis]
MKKLQKLTGVKTLSKKEQKAVKGGIGRSIPCQKDGLCPEGYTCIMSTFICGTEFPE